MTIRNTVRREPILTIPTTRRGKIGCAIGLVIWFFAMLTPCVLFWFAAGNELRFEHANIPDAYTHPFFSIRLHMDADHRGIAFTTSSAYIRNDLEMCVQTNQNYWLWQTNEENLNVVFCQCYERATNTSDWVFIQQERHTCEPTQ